jgi:DNA-binding LacI/PurR family transcriptional regulator
MTKTPKDPKYLTLARRFARQIRSGQLQPGDRLPSFTQMRAEFGATPATVERLYAQLERENLIERRHRSGVFVAARQCAQILKGTIGYMALSAHSPRQNPYSHLLLQGIRQAARAANAQVLLLDPYEIEDCLDKMDGLLINAYEVDRLAGYCREDFPCISVLNSSKEMPSVTADDFAGGRAAAEHLLRFGHTRIAALMGTAADDFFDPLGAQRLEGYRTALHAAGLSPQPEWGRPILYNPMENYAERGYSLMRQWLAEDWPRLGCTAILAQNDDTAIGIIKALQEGGYDVPEEVSVVGFDGAGADIYFSPRLTTIEVPLQKIGMRATQILLQQIGSSAAADSVVMPVALRAGETTATCVGCPRTPSLS